ncbi:hypothetical protein GCM10007301_43590 [Azorhizobium oxalatiphilum]|uniref:Uncharacterized protein n=1 Tax=Azorhizobium oxalatiphilum TaxID=980631 RepID=A0A917FG58_9HYPH|nr:hypothetical protein [Azorhizobium oxalatiphilum]GGF78858.1 hypothetical protein GCM10007301_43590 [Azorhizobium oxalatiphilum]
MLAIVISVCLVTDPAVCRNERIPLQQEMSALQCMVQAGFQVALWNGEHPAWQVVRWRCSTTDDKDI